MAGMISVNINGMETVLGNLNKISKSMPAKIKRVTKSAAKTCFDGSQDDCPVGADVNVSRYHQGKYQGEETTHIGGSLKGSGKMTVVDETDTSIKVEVSYGGESSTGEEVDYQWYVELGTCKMAAQPYLYPNFVLGCQFLQIDLQSIIALSNIV